MFAEDSDVLEAGAGDDAPNQPTPEVLADRLRLTGERYRELHRLFDHHSAEADRIRGLLSPAQDDDDAARDALIRAILRAGSATLPDSVDWRLDPSPVSRATIGDRLYLVVKGRDSDPPDGVEQIAESCTLVVLEKGGVQ